MNASRLRAYQPATLSHLFDLMDETYAEHRLSFRQRGILVTACASTLGDAYCSLSWGAKLSSKSDPETAAGILRGDDIQLSPQEQALAGWARKVASDPNRTSAADVQALRDAGFSDGQIFAITAYVALRIAFSTVNDALGARPDSAYRSTAPAAVLDAVTYGRPIEE
jgi:alkylhydroperoxidase family enzyme